MTGNPSFGVLGCTVKHSNKGGAAALSKAQEGLELAEAASPLRVALCLFPRLAHEGPEDGDKARYDDGKQHDQRPLWFGLSVGFHRFVHNLDNACILRFVYLGKFVLLSEQLVEKFIVLHISQTAEIIESSVA